MRNQSGPKYYRQMAADCARIAKDASSPVDRAAWSKLERQWLDLAAHAEGCPTDQSDEEGDEEPPFAQIVTPFLRACACCPLPEAEVSVSPLATYLNDVDDRQANKPGLPLRLF